MSPRRSLRARLTISFAAAICAVMLALCAGIVISTRRAAERNADAELRAAAREAAVDLSANAKPADVVESNDDLKPLNITVAVYTSEGRPLSPMKPGGPAGILHTTRDWRVDSVRARRQTVVAVMDWRPIRERLDVQAERLLELGALVTLFACTGAWLLVGRSLRPIQALAEQARVSSGDRPGVRLTSASNDRELVDLVQTLNGLLDRVKAAADARGRFHAAASHELRTPLQALAGNLELALSRERTPEEYRTFLREADLHAHRLTALTRDLLMLHQIEGGAMPATERVDISGAAERLLKECLPIAERRGLNVESHLSQAICAEAARTHLEIIERNLLENAFRYGDSTDAVQIQVFAEGREAVFSVDNACASVGGIDAGRLGEPLYRPDVSRTSGTGGAGLGLAICRAAAAANGWKLELRHERGWFRARLTLPCVGA